MKTFQNNLNLGSSVRLFDFLKIHYTAGTVVNDMRSDCDELYFQGQQNPNIKTYFLPAGPASGLNRQAWSWALKFALSAVYVLIFEIIV